MKAQSTGKKYRRGRAYRQTGMSTLEILIAFSILILSISAVIIVTFGNQSLAIDLETNNEAISKAQALLEKTRADSRQNYTSIYNCDDSSATPCQGTIDSFYNRKLTIDPTSITQCGQNIKSTTTWTSGNRLLSIDLTTRVGDIANALSLGGTCDITPPPLLGWNPPHTWASSNFNPDNPTGLDVLNRIVYMTGNGNPATAPNFYIADTNNVPKDTSSGLFITFINGFKANARLNDVKVAKLSDGKIYAFVARNTTTNQLQMIDVTDKTNPIQKGLFQLANVDSAGSYPQAWRIYYYNNRVYVTTRFTAGPELHVFDVSDPNNVSEIGTGTKLGLTVNSLVVTQKSISGTYYSFAYMATSSDNKELFVLNVTNPLNVTEITGASKNLTNPDYADGNAVFLVGNNLYFGRDSSIPDDFYIFNASNPIAASGGLPIIRTADIGTSVIGIIVTGPYSFLATTKANAEFQVWTSNPAQPITKVNTSPFNFPNITTLGNGIKYEDNWIYLASQANDALRILYNNPL